MDPQTTRSLARPQPARSHDHAYRQTAKLLRSHVGRGHLRKQQRRRSPSPQAPARRNYQPPQIPVRRGHWLPHPRPPKPHPQRRRSAAHQPHYRLGHLAGQHTFRLRRAQHWPAPTRHEPYHASHASIERRRQHAGRCRTRPRRDAGRRSHDRHGPRPRREGRAHCV